MQGYAELFEALTRWLTGSNVAAISFGLNIIMFILAIWGFVMYFQQKKEYRLLFAMLSEFGVQEKLRLKGTQVRSRTQEIEAEEKRRRAELEAAEKELKERLPQEARRAYFENTIPVVQKQVFDLAQQLEKMTAELTALGGAESSNSPYIASILSEEVQKHVAIKSEIEKAQSLLAVFTGGTAAVGVLLPYPLNMLALPLAFGALRQSLHLYRLWKTRYR